jgi:hypothetical protein
LKLLYYFLACRSGPKHKKQDAGTTTSKESGRKPIRLLNKTWRHMLVSTKVFSSSRNMTNNELLDIGKNMDKLDKCEEVFYKDQLSTRKFRISEEIDEEHENEICKELV